MRHRLAALLAAAACAAPSAAQQSFTMKLSTPTINDATHEWMKAFKAAAEARAKGRLKVEIYPANQLGSVPRSVEGVALGTIELTFVTVGYFAPYDARFEALDTPGVFDTMALANRALLDPELRKRLSGYGEDKGLEPLACAANGPMAVASVRPVRTSDDFKGLKIRTPGTTALQVNPMRALGASPVAMPIGEGLPSMQNRTIDAVMASPVIFHGFKYYDVTKHQTILPKTYLMACGVANKAFMKSLGPELGQIVREEAAKAQSVFVGATAADLDAGRKAWEGNGGQVLEFAPAEAQRYLDVVTNAIAPIVGAPALKPELEALSAAARRARSP